VRPSPTLRAALLVNPAALKRLTEEVAGHLEAGRPAVARPVQKLALEVSRQLRGEGSAEHVAALEALAALDQGQGHHLVAATLYEEALALRRARDGEGHFATLTLMHNVAYAYQVRASSPQQPAINPNGALRPRRGVVRLGERGRHFRIWLTDEARKKAAAEGDVAQPAPPPGA